MPSKVVVALALALSHTNGQAGLLGSGELTQCTDGPAHKFDSRLECCESLDGYDKAAFLASNNCTNSTDTGADGGALPAHLDHYRSLPATCDVAIVVDANPVSIHNPVGWHGSLRYHNHCLKITATGVLSSATMAGPGSYVELQGKMTGMITVSTDYGTVVIGATADLWSANSRRVTVSADHASIITEPGAADIWVLTYDKVDTKCNGHVLAPLSAYTYCGYCTPTGWSPATRPAGQSGC